MGIGASLQRKSWCEAGAVLPQLNPGLLRQCNEPIAGTRIKPGIRRICNGLFHDSGIDGHALRAGLLDGARFMPNLEGLGQQTLHPFLANATTPTRQRAQINRQLVLEKVSPVRC